MDRGVYASLLRAGTNAMRVSLWSAPISLLQNGTVTKVALGVAIVTLIAGGVLLYIANKYSPYKDRGAGKRRPSASKGE